MNIIDHLNLLVFFIFCFILPGFIINLLFKKKVKLHEALGLSIPLSFFFYLPISFVGYCFELKITTLLLTSVAFLFALIAFLFRIKCRVSIELIPTIVLSLFGLLFYLISLCSGWYPQGDAAIHIQAIRNMMFDGYVSQPYYALIKKELISDHGYDIYYVLISIISKFSKIELTFVWHYIGPIFSSILPFSIFTFGVELTKNVKFGYILITSFIIVSLYFSESMFGGYFDVAQYPNRIYLWFSLIHLYNFSFNYYEFPSKKNFILILVFLIPLIFIHQEGIAIFFLVFFIFCFIHSVKFGLDPSKSLWFLIIALGCISTPFLFLKSHGNLKFIALTNTEIWKEHYRIVEYTNSLFAFPMDNYNTLNLQAFFILTLSVLIYSYKKDISYRVKYLLLASFLVPILFVLNPLTVPILSKYGSFVLVNRLQRAPLLFLSLGVFLYFTNLKFKYFHYIILIAVIIVTSLSTQKLYFNNGIRHKDLRIVEALHLIPENSNIIADPQTSIDIAMYKKTNHSTFKFNGAVDLVNLEKEKTVFTTLLKDSFSLDTITYLKENKINFIITNNLIYKELSPIKNKKIFGNGYYEIYKL